MSLSPRNFFSCSRLLLSCTRVSADELERRSEIPKDSLGATRSLTFGTYVMRLFHMSSHVSPGCTSVEYVRSPRPLPRSIVTFITPWFCRCKSQRRRFCDLKSIPRLVRDNRAERVDELTEERTGDLSLHP